MENEDDRDATGYNYTGRAKREDAIASKGSLETRPKPAGVANRTWDAGSRGVSTRKRRQEKRVPSKGRPSEGRQSRNLNPQPPNSAQDNERNGKEKSNCGGNSEKEIALEMIL